MFYPLCRLVYLRLFFLVAVLAQHYEVYVPVRAAFRERNEVFYRRAEIRVALLPAMTAHTVRFLGDRELVFVRELVALDDLLPLYILYVAHFFLLFPFFAKQSLLCSSL